VGCEGWASNHRGERDVEENQVVSSNKDHFKENNNDETSQNVETRVTYGSSTEADMLAHQPLEDPEFSAV
jgi:hypothetical protein